jgi:hypothetical protein
MGKGTAAMTMESIYTDGEPIKPTGASNPATGDWNTAPGERNTSDADRAEGDLTPDQEEQELRASIEHTRADMSETIDELQERLKPAHVKEMMKERLVEKVQLAKETIMDATLGKVEDMAERMSDTVYETRRGIVEMVKSNPIPSAMVGVGLAWLWMNRRDGASNGDAWSRRQRGSRTSYSMSGGQGRWSSSRGGLGFDDEGDDFYARDQSFAGGTEGAISGAAGQARDTANKIASKARDTMHGVTDKAQQTAGYVAERAQNVARGAQNQARRVEETFVRKLNDAPLAVGAAALALGTAVGLAVPRTRMEDEWLGDARDTLLDKAQSVASQTLDKVGEVAERVTGDMTGAGGAQKPEEQRSAV